MDCVFRRISFILDEDGELDKDKAVSTKDNPKNFEDLTENQKRLPIAF